MKRIEYCYIWLAIVSTPLDLTYASVDKDSLEMDHTVLVSPA